MIDFLRDRINTPVILGFFGLIACLGLFATCHANTVAERAAQIECYRKTIDPKVCDPNYRDNETLRLNYLDSCRQTSRSVDDCLKMYEQTGH